MRLTIEIKDSVADKILYFLENLKDDIKIIKKVDNTIEPCDIEVIEKSDPDYQIILKGREDRKKHPENYISEDDINWD